MTVEQASPLATIALGQAESDDECWERGTAAEIHPPKTAAFFSKNMSEISNARSSVR